MTEQDEELLRKLTLDLERLDERLDHIPPPSVPEMEHFLAAEAVRRRRQSRKELLLFLLAAIFLISAVLAALGSAPVIFWILQAVFPLAALGGFMADRTRLRREAGEE